MAKKIKVEGSIKMYDPVKALAGPKKTEKPKKGAGNGKRK